MTASSDLEKSIQTWFEAGHSRFAMILQGPLYGSVLLISDKRPAAPEYCIRQILSDDNGIVQERRERASSAGEIAADPANGPAVLRAISERLSGSVAPPPICPKPRRP
jgi:hypothetical protein